MLSNLIAQHGSFEEAKLYYSFRGFELEAPDEESDSACLTSDIACDKLTEDNLCALHDRPNQKPVICHRYPWYPDDIEGCGYRWR